MNARRLPLSRTFETWDAAVYFAELMARRYGTRMKVRRVRAGGLAGMWSVRYTVFARHTA